MRQEQTLNAYWRIYKERLQPLLNADFENTKDKTRIAHRNCYLSQSFKNEPDDIRDYVMSNRLNVGERVKAQLNWEDDDEIDEEEKSRRKYAAEYSR